MPGQPADDQQTTRNAGSENTGAVMSWVGTALYTAYAIGAPAGSVLYASDGIAAVGVATMLPPLATVGLVMAATAAATDVFAHRGTCSTNGPSEEF